MHSLQNDYAAGLFDSACEPPCLTLYQPTHRRHPESQQDPIRFLNLVKTLEASLLTQYDAKDAAPALEPFLALAADMNFWNHVHEGLAVLGTRNVFRVYRLQRRMPELAIVADSFHTKPLLRVLQSADRYQVLGVNRQAIRLFEGNRDVLDEIEPAYGVPRTAAEAIGQERTEPHLTVASYGGAGVGHHAMYHGHGGKESEVDIDAERFFRAVDRGILERHSKPSGLPLILATLPEHRSLFRQVSHNPFLIDEGIDVHPDAVSIDDLRERAWRAVEPHYLARLDTLVEAFRIAQSHDRGHDDLRRIARAVAERRVATLLIEADREIAGRVDTTSGEITFGSLDHPRLDDVFDDLAALTLKQGGQVVVVPSARMPTATGAAATYRY